MKQNIKAINNKEQRHGFWVHYINNNELWFKGNYVNGIRYGYWIYNGFYLIPQIKLYLK